MYIDRAEVNPLYEGSIRVCDVVTSTRFLRFIGDLAPERRLSSEIATFISRGYWTGSQLYVVTKIDLYLSEDINQSQPHIEITKSMAELGIARYTLDGRPAQWDMYNFTVKVDEASIKQFYNWLLRNDNEPSARKLQQKWPEWCTEVAKIG